MEWLASKNRVIKPGEDVEKRKPYSTLGVIVKCYRHFGGKNIELSQKIKNRTPHNPIIPLLHIYPKKMKTIRRDICTLMFTAALFIIAKIWKQP